MHLVQIYVVWVACGALAALMLLCLAGRLRADPPGMRALRGVPTACLAALVALASALGSRAVPKNDRNVHAAGRVTRPRTTAPSRALGDELRFTSIAVSSNSVALEVAWPTSLFPSGTTLDLFRACAHTGLYDLTENIVCFLKGESSGRLEKLTDRTDIERHEGAPVGGGLCVPDRSGDDVVHREAGPLHLAAVRAKCICVNDIGAGLDILPVYIDDPVRLQDIQCLRNCSGLHAFGLEHGTHAAVQNNIVLQKELLYSRTSNIHSRCGKAFAKNVNSLRSDSTVFAHSTSFAHEEVLRLVQIV